MSLIQLPELICPTNDSLVTATQAPIKQGGHQCPHVCAGPCIAMDTACSSSLVAMHLAHRGLLDGETTAALALGINLMLVASTYTHLAQLGALSPTGRSKSFDASADGYGRGEACISAVLRPGAGMHTSEGEGRVLAILQGGLVQYAQGERGSEWAGEGLRCRQR